MGRQGRTPHCGQRRTDLTRPRKPQPLLACSTACAISPPVVRYHCRISRDSFYPFLSPFQPFVRYNPTFKERLMTSRLLLAFTVALVLTASTASAQAQAPAGGQKITLAQALQRAYATIKQNLTEAADKLSDADYTWRPSPEIRPYGGQFGHVANAQFGSCSAAKGEA